MKSKIMLIMLTFMTGLLLVYGVGVTGSYFSDSESSIDNILRVKSAPLFGAADDFAVLAGSGITNTNISAITGDVGSHPTATVTGLTSGMVTGTLYTTAEAIVGIAKTDLSTAYDDAVGRSAATLGTELGGTSPAPGVYTAGTFGLTGTLTLTGDANAIWIFYTTSTLVTAVDSQVILNGGARACNVYWVVGSSATLGVDSIFKGNIMAVASITMNARAAVEGRALALTGAVTLDANIITKPTE